jgi:hypothetical protein
MTKLDTEQMRTFLGKSFREYYLERRLNAGGSIA